MDTNEIKKSQATYFTKIIKYRPHEVSSMNIVKKTTGSISIDAVDSGNEVIRKIMPFDIFIQIIEGKTGIVVDDKSDLLKMGQFMIVPAHSSCRMKSDTRFIILSVKIKSGYEESD